MFYATDEKKSRYCIVANIKVDFNSTNFFYLRKAIETEISVKNTFI